jgi:predicted Zn-dependent protease
MDRGREGHVGLVIGGLALLVSGAVPFLVTSLALAQPRAPGGGAADEREALARSQPSAIEAHGRSDRTEVVPLRVRFYADDDHRSGGVRVSDRLRRTFEAINEVIEPSLAVRFEIESVKSWTHVAGKTGAKPGAKPGGRLDDFLEELEALDPARDVDWVVGLVGALPQGSSEIHDVGMARSLGRHFVMRGLSSYMEESAFQRAFPQLDRTNAAELHMIYTRRKEHKEVVVFLHEWAHTLGGLHVGDKTRILAPAYTPETSVLGAVDVGLLAAALKDRLAARGDIERAPDARLAQQQIAWTNLRRFLQTTRAPEWDAADRGKLAALLGGLKGQSGQGSNLGSDAAGLGGADADIYTRALALYRAHKNEEAWRLLAPLASKQSDSPQLQPLLCRLSGLPAARKQGMAACEAGLARAAPDDPAPFLDAVQAAVAREAPEEALGHLREATVRAGRGSPSPATWVTIAEVSAHLGAMHAAERALARAGQAPELEAARAELLRARRFFGLPATTVLPVKGADDVDAREAAYAVAFTRANTAVSARKVAQARKLIDAAVAQFGATPGLQVLTCDVAMRQGRLPEAHRSCASALAGMEDLPRAHYLVGHLHLSKDDGARAVTSFRRAVDLDPTVPAFWDVLAETYTMLGRSKDARAVAAERARALGGDQER